MYFAKCLKIVMNATCTYIEDVHDIKPLASTFMPQFIQIKINLIWNDKVSTIKEG
jgi:hypothetical protein